MTFGQRRLMIWAIMLACVMQMIDTTIAIVALPHMQGSMSAAPDQISWVLTSYIVASAITIPASNFVARRFGRKTVLLTIIAGFSVTSMLCGMAQTLEEIVIFRLLQGMCGAFLMPVSQTIILDYYTVEERPKMMSIWSMGAMVGPVIGPVLGGFLTESLNWRWVFYINLPFGILAFLGVLFVPLETKGDHQSSFRWQGFIYLAVAIGALQLLLDRGNLKDWFSSTEICIEAIVTALFFYLFCVHSLTSKKPFIDFAIFRDRNLSVILVILVIGGALLFATMSLMPPFMQTLLGYPVLTAGLILAPRGASSLLGFILYAYYGNRIDPRLFLGAGIVICTFSLWQMQLFDINVGPYEIILSGAIQGFGLGLFFAPFPILAFATLSKHFQGDGASLLSLVRNLGSSFGISAAGALFAHWAQANHASLTEHITPTNPLLRAGNMPQGLSLDNPIGRAFLDLEISRQAETIAYLNDFRLLMWLNSLCILSLLLLRFSRPKSPASDQPSVVME